MKACKTDKKRAHMAFKLWKAEGFNTKLLNEEQKILLKKHYGFAFNIK